jgi:hypothetical protein
MMIIGIQSVDQLLCGAIPSSAVINIVGGSGSGKTHLALSSIITCDLILIYYISRQYYLLTLYLVCIPYMVSCVIALLGALNNQKVVVVNSNNDISLKQIQVR